MVISFSCFTSFLFILNWKAFLIWCSRKRCQSDEMFSIFWKHKWSTILNVFTPLHTNLKGYCLLMYIFNKQYHNFVLMKIFPILEKILMWWIVLLVDTLSEWKWFQMGEIFINESNCEHWSHPVIILKFAVKKYFKRSGRTVVDSKKVKLLPPVTFFKLHVRPWIISLT